MSEELLPLDEDALAVLGQLGPVRDVPAAARDRIWRAVDARVALSAPPSPGSTGGAPPGPRRAGLRGWITRNPGAAVTGALLVGGVVGAAARGTPSRDGERRAIVALERLPITSSTATPALSPSEPWTRVLPPVASMSHTEATSPLPQAAPAAPRSGASACSPSGTGQQLAAESALLDVARTAIERGESDHAIAAVDRHAATFPNGTLREEREALRVKALVLAGRGEEARARTAQFRARYPESLFLPALASALRSIP